MMIEISSIIISFHGIPWRKVITWFRVYFNKICYLL